MRESEIGSGGRSTFGAETRGRRGSAARSRPLTRLIALMAVALVAAESGSCDEDSVLVLYNSFSQPSMATAAYYLKARSIPGDNTFDVKIPLNDPWLNDPNDEVISREEYVTLIRDPLQDFLEESGLVDSVTVIVTVIGVPLWVERGNQPGGSLLVNETRASVDAELALLFSDLDGSPGLFGSENPYFGSAQPWAEWRAAHPGSPLRYLVARLAGFPVDIEPETLVPADIRRLIDRASETPLVPGTWVVDEDGTGTGTRYPSDLAILRPVAEALTGAGVDVLHDTSPAFVGGVEAIAGYASWGSNDSNDPGPPYYGSIGGVPFPGSFLPRSLAFTIVSTNARSFTHPAAYGQSLIADLIRQGAAGVAGTVTEPGVSSLVHPAIFFSRYLEGATAVEAYFSSLPYLGWSNVFVGDPLMKASTAGSPDADLDGVASNEDLCEGTPADEPVDASGCSLGEFCSAFAIEDDTTKKACNKADWLGDEPGDEEPKDCKAFEETQGSHRCGARS